MLPYRDSRVIRFVLIAFFLIALAYAFFEGRALLRGPSIEVSPRVMEVTESFITISGTAERITSLSMNGKEIAVTETGAFEEGYALAPGYNRITLRAEDRYGKTTERVVEIVYRPKEVPENTPETPDPETE